MRIMKKTLFRHWLLLLLCVMLLAGCSARTQPLSQEERQEILTRNWEQLDQLQPKPDHPLTLPEAVALALVHNLDYRIQAMEEDIAHQQYDLATLEMLPSVDFDGGAHSRWPESASSSESVETRTQSLEPSTSQDRNRLTMDLSLAWNLLDFGMSFYQARQESDKEYIRAELRRKAQQQLVEQVRAAYWRAASAQIFRPRVAEVLAQARTALEDARTVEEMRLRPPLQSLTFQRSLLEVVRQLESLQNELDEAQVELCSLMGMSPSLQLQLLADEQEVQRPPKLSKSVDELVDIALDQRPELRESMYQVRISKNEITRSMLQTLPGLSFRASQKYDSNSFLSDNAWQELSAQVTGNLVDLFTAPDRIAQAESKHELERMRLLSVHMAVVTQVNVAVRQYERIVRDYDMATQINRVEQRIAQIVSNQALVNTQSQVETIRSRVTALFSEMERYRSFAEAQNAYNRILVSLGVDVLPRELTVKDATILVRQIGQTMNLWDSGQVSAPTDEASL
ncbi:Outer membrane protein TolC [Paucidesulfovibrio gracilis DSM 16080]|uniref:Outer membrane protein TolC n=1 Tax=Paucidesulfovibrio gracilis DSM 16080 TaxID=1121449 RepID=A0A1T4W669_9BACT|nr:TolC family protein [Paucidesulfovibrio gracilis]SKA72211.1 Outer membrane protein TolC [Paucidesulfovibrio gracilis DSM 16080]